MFPAACYVGYMASRTMISVEEYLRTVYRPDCDYVDGEVQERNLGEWDHSRAQAKILWRLGEYENCPGLQVFPSLRLRVSETCVRVPDVCAFLESPAEQAPRTPPFLCVEVVSPEDTLMRMRERVDDYLGMGVPYVWVLDPSAKCAYAITPREGWREVKGGVLRTENPALGMPLAEIFA